jgi:hypothetical protein
MMWIRDPGWKNSDPGWKKLESGIRGEKKSDPGSGIGDKHPGSGIWSHQQGCGSGSALI